MQVNISAREGGRTEREYPIAARLFLAAMRKEIDTSNRKMSGGIYGVSEVAEEGTAQALFPGSQ